MTVTIMYIFRRILLNLLAMNKKQPEWVPKFTEVGFEVVPIRGAGGGPPEAGGRPERRELPARRHQLRGDQQQRRHSGVDTEGGAQDLHDDTQVSCANTIEPSSLCWMFHFP